MTSQARRPVVDAGTLLPPAVVPQRGRHDQGDLAGRQLAPPGPDFLQAAAQQASDVSERLARQRQRALTGKRGALGGLGSGCIHARLMARRGASRQAGPLQPAGQGALVNFPAAVRRSQPRSSSRLSLARTFPLCRPLTSSPARAAACMQVTAPPVCAATAVTASASDR